VPEITTSWSIGQISSIRALSLYRSFIPDCESVPTGEVRGGASGNRFINVVIDACAGLRVEPLLQQVILRHSHDCNTTYDAESTSRAPGSQSLVDVQLRTGMG